MAESTPESDAMPPEGTAVKSTLDKPLHKLTEDDIAQITREDCRRYLKEKGLRKTDNSIYRGSHFFFFFFVIIFGLFFWCRDEETVVEQIAGDSASDNAENASWNDTGLRRRFTQEASLFPP